MKKKWLLLIGVIISMISVPVSAISEAQKNAIIDHCAAIQNDLKNLQRDDSRTRVYLGRYYETVLTKYITPLNVRLVENILSNDNLVNNQNDLVKTRMSFNANYVEYQKALESLVSVDCKTEPERFYRKLTGVREKRQIVAEDVTKLRKIITTQISLVESLKEKL